MDKKLSRAVDVLDALDSYFQSLEGYLKQTDREKFTRLERGISECRNYKRKLEAVKLDDEGLFQAVHLHVQVQNLLQTIYNQLDFQLPVGEEISKTRAYRMSEVFNKITAIYRTYIRDIAAESNELVMDAAGRIKTTDPLELQLLWQKWPSSIELYMVVQTRILDQSYRDKDTVKRQQIFEILESDKRYILNEKAWMSPFLTFNCVPWRHLKPMKWADLLKEFESSGNAIDGAGPEAIDGAIVVRRHQGASVIHILPRAMEWGPGITEGDIAETLAPVPASAWQWDVKIHDTKTTEHYYIFESLAEDHWRLLVPWKFSKMVVPRDLLVHKIKNQAFGRPDAYHGLLEQALTRNLSKRVAVISVEAARPHDVSLSVLRVTDLLLTAVKKGRGDVYARVDDERLDKIFEASVLEELSKHDPRLLDAVVYWVDWSRQNFRRDLDAAVEKAEQTEPFGEWNVVTEHRVEKCLHNAVDAQLRKTSNVFQDLFDKQHKLDEIRIHTRRHD
jgi:hypothetical protein